MASARLPVIGISCGDLNGIGLEVILKTLSQPAIFEICIPVLFASGKVVSFHKKALGMEDLHFESLREFSKMSPGKAYLVNCWKEDVSLNLGRPDPSVASYAVRSLDAACAELENGNIDALLTAPIHKESIQGEAFRFSGHTDYLEARFQGKATMMLVNDELRMALATVHIPLNKVSEQLSVDAIVDRLKHISDTLNQDFLIKKARIAVLSLNPHAGDGGVIGVEDDEIVGPAIKKAFEERIMAFGPFPADGFFGSGKFENYDAILAMYHDQGLIPFKTLSFGSGVNFSSGLKIIRTSPDHGTGFDIAGKGVANESSFRKALYLAIDVVRNRSLSKEISANPLVSKKLKKEY